MDDFLKLAIFMHNYARTLPKITEPPQKNNIFVSFIGSNTKTEIKLIPANPQLIPNNIEPITVNILIFDVVSSTLVSNTGANLQLTN